VLPYVAGLATAASLMIAVWQPWEGETAPAPVETDGISTSLGAEEDPLKDRMITVILDDGRIVEVPARLADPLLDDASRKELRHNLPEGYDLVDHDEVR